MGQSIAGSLIQGVGSLVGGGASAAASIANNKAQIEAQQQSQENQNAWQSAENDKDRMWQQQFWLQQFQKEGEEWSRRFGQENEEWSRRFDEQNAYNDPSAVVQRLKQAGINPAAAMGQLTGSGGLAAAGGSSNPSTTAPAMPSPGAAHSVAPMGLSNPNNVVNIGSVISSVADMLNASTNAKRLGLDTKYQEATLDAVVEKLKADSSYQEKAAALADFDLKLKEAVGDSHIRAQISNLMAQAALFDHQGKNQQAQAELNKALKILTDTKNKAILDALPELINNISRIGNVYQSESFKNYALGHQAKEEAATTAALRDGRVEGLRLENRLKSFADEINESTKEERIGQIVEELHQSRILTSEMRTELDILRKKGDWVGVREFLGALGDAASVVGKGASAYADVRNANTNAGHLEVSYDRNEISREFNRIYEERTYNNKGKNLKRK